MIEESPVKELLEFDHDHIWHPYSAMHSDTPVYPVKSAKDVYLTLADGRILIDGMSSWWSAIHGYNHPAINNALTRQLEYMAHVMFGGLTHSPAVNLARQLLKITPDRLQNVFFSDSGSVAVEVAMKMAIQYWQSLGFPQKQRFIALKSSYHGDTFGAMSVCDPETGMHTLFRNILPAQVFIEQPQCRFGEPCSASDITPLEQALSKNQDIAAVILEPIVQGAGGMWFYSAEYLKQARELCDKYHVLLILDEIATGFGRTGEMFACDHAAVTPDIMCLGKALTGGYLSLAATLTTSEISKTIDRGSPGLFMHGPTFMGNPLACTAALTSLLLLQGSDWKNNISRIQKLLTEGLEPCKEFNHVKDVRTLGAIGVVEMINPVDIKSITECFINAGVWIRPFGKLIYLMPPYIIKDEQIKTLTQAIVTAITTLS